MTKASPISAETFEAFLQCETKSKLYSRGAIGVDLELTDWQRSHRDKYKESGLSWLQSNSQAHELYVGTLPFEALKQKRWRVIADYFAESVDISARLDAVELYLRRSTGSVPTIVRYALSRTRNSHFLTNSSLHSTHLRSRRSQTRSRQMGKSSMAANTEQP